MLERVWRNENSPALLVGIKSGVATMENSSTEVLLKAESRVIIRGFPGGSEVKNLPAIQEIQVWFLGWEDPLEEGMETHSSILSWRIPWTEEPGKLQSMGSRRTRHNWATSLSLFTFMHWRKKWQPTPVFLPGESQGRGSPVGCHLWGRTESDTTEAT